MIYYINGRIKVSCNDPFNGSYSYHDDINGYVIARTVKQAKSRITKDFREEPEFSLLRWVTSDIKEVKAGFLQPDRMLVLDNRFLADGYMMIDLQYVEDWQIPEQRQAPGNDSYKVLLALEPVNKLTYVKLHNKDGRIYEVYRTNGKIHCVNQLFGEVARINGFDMYTTKENPILFMKDGEMVGMFMPMVEGK